MATRSRSPEVSATDSLDSPALSSVELPPAGEQTRRVLEAACQALKTVTPSERNEPVLAFKALVRGVAVRGADEDLRGLLELLESGRLVEENDEAGRPLEPFAVEALLASGNALVLGLSPDVFARFQRATDEGTPARVRFGRLLLAMTCVAAMFGIGGITSWTPGAATPIDSSDTSSRLSGLAAFLMLGLLLSSVFAVAQSLRRSESPPVFAPVSAAILALVLAVIAVANGEFLLAGGATVAIAGAVSLIPRKRKLEM